MAIVSVFHHDPAHCAARSCYEYQANLLLTLHRSLRHVGTTLPIHVLLSGWHDPRLEKALQAGGAVTLHREEASAVRPPSWAIEWHRSTFAKLLVLNLSRALEARVLFLDNDVIALRNVDHLQNIATDAICVKPWEGLNSGVMVLDARTAAPGALDVDDVWNFVAQMSHRSGGDGGEQNALNLYFATRRRAFRELPARYNVYTVEMNSSATAWWDEVVLWHKYNMKLWNRWRSHPAANRRLNATLAALRGPRFELDQPFAPSPVPDGLMLDVRCATAVTRRVRLPAPPIASSGSLAAAKAEQWHTAAEACQAECGPAATAMSVSLRQDACECHGAPCNATQRDALWAAVGVVGAAAKPRLPPNGRRVRRSAGG